MRFAIPVFIAAASCAAALSGQEPKTAPKAELEKLQGKWDIVAMERDGRSAPKEYCASLIITIAGDKMTLGQKAAGGPSLQHQIRLDPGNPKAMDLIVTDGSGKGQVMLGIYEFDGKTLKMCHTDAGAKNRPTEFRSPAGTFLSVVTVTRHPM